MGFMGPRLIAGRNKNLRSAFCGAFQSYHVSEERWTDFDTLESRAALVGTVSAHQCVSPDGRSFSLG